MSSGNNFAGVISFIILVAMLVGAGWVGHKIGRALRITKVSKPSKCIVVGAVFTILFALPFLIFVESNLILLYIMFGLPYQIGMIIGFFKEPKKDKTFADKLVDKALKRDSIIKQ